MGLIRLPLLPPSRRFCGREDPVGASGAGKARLPFGGPSWHLRGGGNEEGGVRRGRNGSPKPTRPSLGWQDPPPLPRRARPAFPGSFREEASLQVSGQRQSHARNPRRRRRSDSHENGNLKTTKTHGPVSHPHTSTHTHAALEGLRRTSRRDPHERPALGRDRRCSWAGGWASVQGTRRRQREHKFTRPALPPRSDPGPIRLAGAEDGIKL